jgi:hypothetical protein
VESSAVLASASQPLDAAAFTPFVREMLGEKQQTGSYLFRSALVPGWGQLYAGSRVHALVGLGAYLAAGGATAVTFGVSAKRAKEYDSFIDQTKRPSGESQLIEEFFGDGVTRQSPQFDDALFNFYKQQREDSLWSAYTYKRSLGFALLGVTAGVWALNLIDALIVGKKKKSSIDLYFSTGYLQAPVVQAGVRVYFYDLSNRRGIP